MSIDCEWALRAVLLERCLEFNVGGVANEDGSGRGRPHFLQYLVDSSLVLIACQNEARSAVTAKLVDSPGCDGGPHQHAENHSAEHSSL